MTASTRRQRHRETGSATVWMVFGTVIVLCVAGLVYDGGGLIAAKRAAINDAEQTARAGAQAVDTDTVMTAGRFQLDPGGAVARGEEFLAANGWDGTVTADTTSVTVTITRHRPLTFLQTFGVGARPVTGTATARPRHDLARS